MKSSVRIAVALAASITVAGLSGCQKDNETKAELTGVAPVAAPGGPAPPKNQAEREQQYKQQKNMYGTSGYPGANNAPK